MNRLEKKLHDYFISSTEATRILNISKQNLNSLAIRGKITRVKKGGVTLYLKEEINERALCQDALRKKYRPYDFSRGVD
ncbi:MAG: helix-turn-helix domain-containing protein [Enterococcus lacertideformus]|uniref:Helix-turn-helix domain-containing protein n=1 Tax=Enterococcus lacertideformus TaxID=2771493 RepID=A0A931AX31_9ENTE|nr:helix-turn-helix domain-containing protein [Enterococcus lacertideformus]